MNTTQLRILLIKRGAMGDVLMATPLIRQLKINLNCQIDILIGKISSVIVKDNPYIDQKYILDDEKLKLAGVFSFALELIKKRGVYDYVFVLDKHWYFNLMAQLIGSSTVGFYRDRFSKLLLSKSVEYHDINRYQSLYYLDLLKVSKLASPNYDDIALDLVIKNNDKAAELLKSKNIKKFVAVVNSGGNNGYENTGIRMLPQQKIIQLLQILLSKPDIAIILLGGANDVDNYNEYLRILKEPPQLFNFAGKLSITDSAYLIHQAEMFYTTDCGAMHIGVAVRSATKMRAFFGPTNPQHFLPAKYIEAGVAVWNDQDVYDPEYQMRGVKNTFIYFEGINIPKNILK